jgi:hypothetical protein
MTFRVELLVRGELTAAIRTPELEVSHLGLLSAHDELVHVLAAQCRALAGAGAVSFEVGGFGQERWPVDVETDLAVAVEQLPGVLAAVSTEGKPFELNFYEQGIERYITGTTRAGTTTFECMSMSLNWTAEPSVEHLPLVEAERMFRTLRDRYCSAVERVSPWLAATSVFEQWRRTCLVWAVKEP